jgi:anti-sigma factor (TIGR02949 family)
MTFLLTCKEFLQELSDFLDETVDSELRSRLEAHITACPNCFVILNTTQRTIQVYKGVDAQPIPEEIHARLMRAVDQRAAARRQTNAT